jgi:hypothetical protein
MNRLSDRCAVVTGAGSGIMDDDPAGRIAALQLAPGPAQQLRCGNAERWLGLAPHGSS